MTLAKRAFGKPASMKDILLAGKEFTDAAMDIDIEHVLRESRYKRNIGRTAANLSGVGLQREGDGTSKRIVFAAYDNLYDLLQPSFDTFGVDATQELFAMDKTRKTLLHLSTALSSYGMGTVAHGYRTRGDYLHMTEGGLELNADPSVIPRKFESNKGGCPYAKAKGAPYFQQVTDHVVETYALANLKNMPHSWLNAASRSLTGR